MKIYTIGIMSWWCETRYRVKGHLLQTSIDGVIIVPRLILRLEDDTTIVIKKILSKTYKVYPDYYFKEPETWHTEEPAKKSSDTDTEPEATPTVEVLPLRSTEEPTTSETIFVPEERPFATLTEIISRISEEP